MCSFGKAIKKKSEMFGMLGFCLPGWSGFGGVEIIEDIFSNFCFIFKCN